MKALVSLLLSALLLSASLTTQIRQKQRELRSTKEQISGVNLRLNKIAKNIKALRQEIAKIDEKLKTLNASLQKISKQKERRYKEFQQTKQLIDSLTQRHSKLKEQLILMISNSFSKSLLLNSLGEEGEGELLKEEVLKAIQQKEDEKLKQVSSEYARVSDELEKKKKLLAQLQKQIEDLMRKQSTLKSLKIIKAKKLKKLTAQKERYDSELQQLLEQQKSLASTLEKLKILKAQRSASASSAKVRVKKYGGYKKTRSVRYKGPKTIPPLKRFIIVKKYGVYKDPIYNIEIPNENIELKPLEPNAKVRNVLNGKVIMAKWTPHLKNVVIVKHSGNLYTIYANIDRLSPFVKKGRRIKKGYILGRVNKKLIFEVTKNNAHINPLDLITLR